MHFGKTLQASIYTPWEEYYIDYPKLKRMLREGSDGSDDEHEYDSDREWTEQDESAFVEELITIQLEKVNGFQMKISTELKKRTSVCEARLEKLVTAQKTEAETEEVQGSHHFSEEERLSLLRQTFEELDLITNDMKELERFARINFTGFLKAAKKHDRTPRGTIRSIKGSATNSNAECKVRPLLQVRLSQLEFNKEDYSPLLFKLSAMYSFVREHLGNEQSEISRLRSPSMGSPSQTSENKRVVSHKFWVHSDNVLEVKTFLLRRLPVLIYNPQPAKSIELYRKDPAITSLYFDNRPFSLYTEKVLKTPNASSVRLRWYGQLSEAQEVYVERKTVGLNPDDSEGASEERVRLKAKHVMGFLNGDYTAEKLAQKLYERNTDETEVQRYISFFKGIQQAIDVNKLNPMLRAVYTRTAFQVPGDDRIRVSLDTDLALIREDVLDSERPCRDPSNWHRTDIDDNTMEFPFSHIRKGEISRFPHALLELRVLDSQLHGRSKEWINELASSHLVHPAPRFSKFVHGVAVLFDDYVNSFPFWLSDLDKDIRKNPKEAWEAEQERAQKELEDHVAVGSFTHMPDFGGRSPMNRPSMLAEMARINSQGTVLKPGSTVIPNILPESEHGSGSRDSSSSKDATQHPSKPIGHLRQLFPTFSMSRYGRAHGGGRRAIELPPGVRKPKQLLMYSNPVKVEPKVWLANQRTFIKWMHITVLLASLSLALLNSAGDGNRIAKAISFVYTCIAIFAGFWGWSMYMWRTKLIKDRSGRDFDNVLGPIVVCFTLAIALVANFIFKYRNALDHHTDNGNHNVISSF